MNGETRGGRVKAVVEAIGGRPGRTSAVDDAIGGRPDRITATLEEAVGGRRPMSPVPTFPAVKASEPIINTAPTIAMAEAACVPEIRTLCINDMQYRELDKAP